MRPLSTVLLLAALLGSGPALGAGMSLSSPPGAGQPSGPAAGDLGGSYPSPTVTSVEHVATGTVAIANGGTGVSSLSNHGVVVAGSSTLSTIAPGTSGYVLTSDGTDWTSSALPSGPVPIQAAWLSDGTIANTYIYAPLSTGSGGSSSPGQNTLRAAPIVFGRAGTIVRLGCLSTATVANAKARVGIYESGSSGYPSSSLGETGELDVSSAGFKSTGSLSIAVVAGKVYWLAFLGGTATASMWAPSTNTSNAIIAAQPGASTATNILGITVAQTYGTMPSTFPASGTGISSGPTLPHMYVGITP